MVEETRRSGQVDGPNKGFNWTFTGRTLRAGAGSKWLEEAASHQTSAKT